MRKFLSAVIIFALTGAVAFLLWEDLNIRKTQRQSQPAAWTEKEHLEYANTLLSKGLDSQAAEAFEFYLGNSSLDKKALAAAIYRLGNIYMDLEEYEKAVRSFYKSEILDNQAEYKTAMNEQIVEALEKLGLSKQAQYELESRTSLGAPVKEGENVVAQIGNRKITESQIEQAIEMLPEMVQGEFSPGEGRLDFIKQYVATEILYDKAKKLGLDKYGKIKDYLEDFKKQFIVQQLVQQQISKDLKISPQDLELYYKANKDRYAVAEAVKVSYLELEDPLKKDEVINNLKSGKGVMSGQWIEKDGIIIPGIGDAEETIEMLFKEEKSAIAGPLKIKDKEYIFIIDDKRAREEKSFDQVKEQVEIEYRNQKQQELINLLLEKTLEEQEVKILYTPDEDKSQSQKEDEGLKK